MLAGTGRLAAGASISHGVSARSFNSPAMGARRCSRSLTEGPVCRRAVSSTQPGLASTSDSPDDLRPHALSSSARRPTGSRSSSSPRRGSTMIPSATKKKAPPEVAPPNLDGQSLLADMSAGATVALVSSVTMRLAADSTLLGLFRWLTDTLAIGPLTALSLLPRLGEYPLKKTLEPARQWLLNLGLTNAEVALVVRKAPRAFVHGRSLLELRLRFYADSCGMGVPAACNLLRSEPRLWQNDPAGPGLQAKMDYWRDELGFSSSELSQAPKFLASSVLPELAGRLRFLKALESAPEMPSDVKTMLGSGAPFATKALAAYTQSRLSSGHMQAALLPLAKSLLQSAAAQKEWKAVLERAPASYITGKVDPEQAELCAQLWRVYSDDWLMSAAGSLALSKAAVAKKGERPHNATALGLRDLPLAKEEGLSKEDKRSITQLRQSL